MEITLRPMFRRVFWEGDVLHVYEGWTKEGTPVIALIANVAIPEEHHLAAEVVAMKGKAGHEPMIPLEELRQYLRSLKRR